MGIRNIILLFQTVVLLIGGALSSCTSNSTDSRIQLLTNCNYRYWDIYNREENFPYGSCRFDVDGSCYYLKFYPIYDSNNNYTKKYYRNFFFTEDVIVPNIYFLKGDSIAFQSGYPEEHILYFSQDSICLVREGINYFGQDSGRKWERFTILKPSKDQTDAFNFDSLKKCKNKRYRFNKEYLSEQKKIFESISPK